MQIKIDEKLYNNVEKLALKYGLDLVLLFGSQSNGRIHKESDVDVAYLSNKLLSFEQEFHLNYELTNVFRYDRVDTVDLKKAKPLLMYAIFQHPKILFQADNKLFFQYRSYAFKRYIESKPLYQEKAKRLYEQFNIINQ